VPLMAEKYRPGGDFRDKIGSPAPHVALFLQMARRTNLGFREIHITGRAALGRRSMALNASQAHCLEMHGV